jgi:hypothetical protein
VWPVGATPRRYPQRMHGSRIMAATKGERAQVQARAHGRMRRAKREPEVAQSRGKGSQAARTAGAGAEVRSLRRVLSCVPIGRSGVKVCRAAGQEVPGGPYMTPPPDPHQEGFGAAVANVGHIGDVPQPDAVQVRGCPRGRQTTEAGCTVP